MPVDGLSLVGFMDEREAIAYLDRRCVWPDDSTGALRHHWAQAKARLGPAVANAGQPSIEPLPARFQPYARKLRKTAGFRELLDSFAEPELALVELGPLLAYQHDVETPRATKLFGDLSSARVSMRDLLEVCLPLQPESYQPQVAIDGHGLTLRSDSLNLRIAKHGLFPNGDSHYHVAGALLGMTGPLFHVARFNGRLYLRNGFHRAFALQRAGVRSVPCAVVDADHFENTGARGDAFSRGVLEGPNPPAVAHYTEARAYAVSLRRLSKVISVTWREDIFIEP